MASDVLRWFVVGYSLAAKFPLLWIAEAVASQIVASSERQDPSLCWWVVKSHLLPTEFVP